MFLLLNFMQFLDFLGLFGLPFGRVLALILFLVLFLLLFHFISVFLVLRILLGEIVSRVLILSKRVLLRRLLLDPELALDPCQL